MRILTAMLSLAMILTNVPMNKSNIVEIAHRDFTEKVEIPNWEYEGNTYVDFVDNTRVLSIADKGSAKTTLEAKNASGILTVHVKSGTGTLTLTNVDKNEFTLTVGKNDLEFTDLDGDITIELSNNSGSNLVIQSIESDILGIKNGNFSESIKIPGFLVVGEQILVKNNALELHDLLSNKASTVRTNRIEVDASKEHQLHVDLEVIAQSHSVEIGVEYLNDKGVSVDYKNVLVRSKAGKGRFTEVLDLPATAKNAAAKYVTVTFNSGAISITEAKFHSLSLLQVSEDVVVEEIHDTILNPDFENGLNDWVVVTENEPFKVVDTASYKGNHSLYLQDLKAEGANDTARILSNKVKVVPGSTYLATAKVNVETQSHSIVLVVEYYDATDKSIKVYEELFSSNSLGTNKWTTIRKMSDAPSDAAYMRIGFYSGKPSITKAYFDDVVLREVDNAQNLDRTFNEPINLGTMVDVGLGQAGAIGQNELGENEVYFLSNGSPGTFYALDGDTGAVKFSKSIPNTIAVWAITIGLDKNVYFGGTEDGALYRYNPVLKEVELLGHNPADKWIWDLEVSESGKIYGTTYPNAKLFSFDPSSKEFADLGSMHSTQQYARGLGIDGDSIYVGIGTNAKHLIKYSISKGTKEEVIIGGFSGAGGSFEDIRIVGDYLFLSNGTVNMLVVNKHTLEIASKFQYSNNIAYPSKEDPHNIYFKFEKVFFKFNLLSLEKTEIKLDYDLPDTVRTKDIKWVVHNGVAKIALLTQYAEYMLIDPVAQTVEFVLLEVSMQAVDIQALEVGFDGRLYMGGYQRGMSIYNPFTNKIEASLPTFAQPEGIGFLNGRVWYGTYVDAIMYSFDPSKPISFNENPNYEYKIKDQQDRPFAIEAGDDKLFVGTIPDYGVHGGVLAIYDEKSNTWTQHRNVVKDQSIISLAYKDGFLYGGTSVWGGLGADPIANEAEMFIWDVEKEALVKSFKLVIPGIDEVPRMIGNMEFGPDGLLWGIVDGTIFAFDTETEEVVKSKMIQPSLYNSSKWFPYRLHFAPDGLLYTTISRKLVAIDPETLDHKILVDQFINNMTVGSDGTIFYALKSTLYKIEVPETDATLSTITVNGETVEGFSSGVLDYDIELLVDDMDMDVVIGAITTQDKATYTMSTEGELTTIKVVGEDGKSTLTYTIRVKKIVEETTDPVLPSEEEVKPPVDGNLPETGFATNYSGPLFLALGIIFVLISRRKRFS